MDERLRLTELVCARLCHDLSGLLGSLVGTLEIVAEEAGTTEATSIATDTATILALRLTLLRAAWASLAEPLDLPRLTALARGLATNRVSLDLSGLPAATEFPLPVGRLVLNLLLLATESLPRGGVLRLDGAAADVVARLEGPDAAWPVGFIGMLTDEAAAWQALTSSKASPRTVQAPLTALLARNLGVHLTVLLSAGPSAAPPLRLTTA